MGVAPRSVAVAASVAVVGSLLGFSAVVVEGVAPEGTPVVAPAAAAAPVSGGLGYTSLAAPCRAVDTRAPGVPGGDLTAGETRNFQMRGSTTFAGQGGSPSGCGVPDTAAAVEVSITAVTPAGANGFVRAFPAGSSVNAAFLNYTVGRGITNTGTVALNTAWVNDLGIANFGGGDPGDRRHPGVLRADHRLVVRAAGGAVSGGRHPQLGWVDHRERVTCVPGGRLGRRVHRPGWHRRRVRGARRCDDCWNPSPEGKVYCAAVMDAFSRRIVGWSIDSRQDSTLVVNALDMAIQNRRPEPGGIVHADHGVQFTSWAFGNRIRSAGLMPSFGSVGDGLDNAMMESFWSSMQIELLNRRRWKTRVELANAIFDYIEIFHNRQRRHSALGYRTPTEFENLPDTISA